MNEREIAVLKLPMMNNRAIADHRNIALIINQQIFKTIHINMMNESNIIIDNY